ncbi:MAG TPA: hypothetical protein PLK30_00335 [Blastocatellia bacterium]|nr:hypothetical protein [Blastocatellia bacterium]
MDFLLLTIALLLLLLAGVGISLWLLPKRPTSAAELFALSFLFGSATVSMASFLLGFVISGNRLRWSVALLCVAIGWNGIRQLRVKLPHGNLHSSKWLFVLAATQLTVVAWLSSVRVLGWDGLFNFEIKARLAFLNGGVLPLELLSDPSRTWTLQGYPLLLPLTESWFYGWLGRADQHFVKLLFPLFFAAALCLFSVGNRLSGTRSWRQLVPMLLIFTVPSLLIGDGSASSGYADFPLAVFYLASIIYLAEFWQSDDPTALRLAGAIAAAGCWLKQEGAILWFCVMALTALRFALTRTSWRDWKQLAKAAFPGLLIIAGWQIFARLVSLPDINQFSPLRFATLRSNLWRIPIIAEAVLRELTSWRHWGLLWLVVLAAIVWLFWQRSRSETLLPLAILLPLAFYSSIYVFSLWPSFLTHLESSFPRLLIQISLVAVWTAAVAFQPRRFGTN